MLCAHAKIVHVGRIHKDNMKPDMRHLKDYLLVNLWMLCSIMAGLGVSLCLYVFVLVHVVHCRLQRYSVEAESTGSAAVVCWLAGSQSGAH